MTASPPPPIGYEPLLLAALAEDLGRAGDRTTDALGLAEVPVRTEVVAREPGRIAGLVIAMRVFTLLDPTVRVEPHVLDGTDVSAPTVLATVTGPAGALLAGERTALNVLAHLSGCATATRDLVAAVRGHRARVVPTRKTLPGLRALQRYAVRVGGGHDHRFGLDDGILIKDNHIALTGGVTDAVRRARERAGHMVKIEVEVDTLDQLAEVLPLGVDAVLLDNMTPDELAIAVSMAGGRVLTEASGGIRLATAAAVAASGVDLLSAGWLTQSVTALDVACDAPGAAARTA